VARAFNGMTGRLQETTRRRQQFMSDIAHELRTPLAIIQGRLEGIVDGVYAPTADQIAALAGEARTLSRLVDDLGALARAESAELDLCKEPTDLAPLLRDVAASFTSDAGPSVQVDAGELPAISIDPVRIREVVSNVVSNAVRYAGSHGAVTMKALARDRDIGIEVSDTGPGIPPDRLPSIFERFSKDPASPGSGLGLAIASALVRAHGGHIRAENGPAGGAIVRITLPRD
jgi:two-component system sensor histidine kinase BaeS